MGNRAQEVGDRFVEKLFSGRRAKNVEIHVGKDEVREITAGAYRLGFEHGKSAREVRELRLGLRAPAVDPSDAVATAVNGQDDAIHAIAQYVLEHEDELRATLVRGGRLGDRPDLADDLRELLKGWREAGTEIRDSLVEAGKEGGR